MSLRFRSYFSAQRCDSSWRSDQLRVHADLIARLLHAAFQNISYTELLRDLRQVRWCTLVSLGRRSRDDFQVRDFRQAGENFFLNAIGEIRGVGFAAEIREGQNGDRFVIDR